MPYDVVINRLPLRALFELKGSGLEIAAWCGDALPEFPDKPNTASSRNGRTLIWTGPDRWLLNASGNEEETLIRAVRPDAAPGDLSIVLISDTLTFFEISGPEADEVMAVATPMNIHPSAFPADGACFTEAFGTKALLRRVANGFEIAVDRSYGDWFEESLRRAAS